MAVSDNSYVVTGADMVSLADKIREKAGVKEDPIPWAQNMVLYKDKYYTQNDVLYLCVQDSVNPLAYDLNELIGIYVNKIES
jgi:hypothetical protein